MEEWGLEAVVTGSADEEQTSIDNPIIMPCFEYDQALLFSFPELYESKSTVLGNELEQFYKPFYPSIFSNLDSTSNNNFNGGGVFPAIDQVKQELAEETVKPICRSTSVSTPPPPPPSVLGAKHKRRKNQQKRVVVQVTADGLASDLWAWRKYGQKPIKGSPYPRSYYRCSTSKGCLARRQVEQSCTDPGVYILTYTAEHNHAQPTRRNSLAGINRNKFRTSKSPAISDEANTTKSKDSPTTPSFSSIEEEVVQQPIKQEKTYSEDDDNHEQKMGESVENDFVFPDMMFSDDFFVGLEDLDGFTSDLPFYNCSTKQFPVSFCS